MAIYRLEADGAPFLATETPESLRLASGTVVKIAFCPLIRTEPA